MARNMKAAIFVEPIRIELDEKPIPDVGPLDVLIRETTTTICGTDIHILKGEYPVTRGLTIGQSLLALLKSSARRLDTSPLVTHRLKLDQIEEAYDLFANQRDGVLKVAISN